MPKGVLSLCVNVYGRSCLFLSHNVDSDVCWNAILSPLSLIPCRIFNVTELNVLEGSGEMKVFFNSAFSHTLCERILKFSGPGKCFIHYNSAMLCDPDDSWYNINCCFHPFLQLACLLRQREHGSNYLLSTQW